MEKINSKVYFIPIKKRKVSALIMAAGVFTLILGCESLFGNLNIALRIEGVKVNYSLGEVVEIKYFIANDSPNKVIICRYPATEKITFIYIHKGEKKLKEDYVTFDVPKSSDDFITIKPKSTYQLSIAQFDKMYFDKPGLWQVQVEQKYNISGGNFGIKGWTGSLKSNQVTILIKE